MLSPVPPAPSAAADLWRKLRDLSSLITVASIYGSGLLGIVVVQAVGPYLAMGAQMYTGDTEPQHPALAWPLGWTLLAGLLPVPPLALRRWAWMIPASIPVALIPWWQLWRLYQLAGSGGAG